MSRHRIVRTMDYNDEYDGYQDVYGHSVDDENSLSPTDASQWIYDRARGQQSISAFMKKNRNIQEEDEDGDDLIENNNKMRRDSDNFQLPVLDELDQVKLTSCIDEVRSVVGDAISERKLVEQALKCNFDFAMTLEALLNEDKLKNENSFEKGRRDMLPKSSGILGNRTVSPAIVPTVIAVSATDINIKKGFEPGEERITQLQSSNQKKIVEISQDDTLKLVPKVSKENNHHNALEFYKKERGNEKEHLHMVVVGHVDAGKSTLMGHLLYDTGYVSQRVMNKHEHESKKNGKQSFAFAWVLDETGEERTRGITMDVGSSRIETLTKNVILLDAPGHKDFIPNMISGASQADVSLLVVDATRGEFETGFEQGGQTREHALLVRSLGVSQMGVVINKLDTVDWSQERFNEIVTKLKAFLKQAGFKETEVFFVPCSGLTGENLVKEPTETALVQWYKGPTLLNAIDTFKIPKRSIEKPLRMSVSDIFKGTGSNFCVSGRIDTGILCINDKVLINPIREQATVKVISIDEISKSTAFAGDQVSITLSGVDINNVQVGQIICDPINAVPITTRIQARVLVFNVKTPITIGFPVLLHHQSLIEPANICKLIAVLHKGTGEVIKKKPRLLGNNSCALIEVETAKPLCVEKFSDFKELGRIMLRLSGVTIAAGMITKIY